MTPYNKITALYSRLSVGDEDRDGGESNSIVNQKAFLERYARQDMFRTPMKRLSSFMGKPSKNSARRLMMPSIVLKRTPNTD